MYSGSNASLQSSPKSCFSQYYAYTSACGVTSINLIIDPCASIKGQ